MYFFCFLNIFLAAKLSEWRLFWVQNENGRGRLDFWATTFFFGKINVTFLDVRMILIGFLISRLVSNFKIFHKQTSPGMEESIARSNIVIKVMTKIDKYRNDLNLFLLDFSLHVIKLWSLSVWLIYEVKSSSSYIF